MNHGEIILYQSSDGTTSLDVKLEQETIWLTQMQMIELFQSSKQNISLHINNVFREKELDKDSVVKEYLTTASDGSKRIGNNTLVALTLMIAESRTEEMDTMVKVVVNLINKNN